MIELDKIGLKINLHKTIIFGNANIVDRFCDPDLPNLSHSSDGFIVLGCPVGSADFVKEELMMLYKNFHKHLALLKKIDIQTSFIVFKYKVGITEAIIYSV